jgi:hypothetical protein
MDFRFFCFLYTWRTGYARVQSRAFNCPWWTLLPSSKWDSCCIGLLGTSLYSPFPSLPLQLLLVPAPRSSAVSYAGCFWFLWLSLSWLFPQVSSLLSFGRSLHKVATPWRTASYLCLFSLVPICGSTSTAVVRFHPGGAAITRGLAIYSWRAPGIQEAPFATQLLLRHAALGTVAHTVAWGSPFWSAPRRKCPFKGTPAARPHPPSATR